jgi:hypothetical protein
MVRLPIIGRPFFLNFSALYRTGALAPGVRRFLELARAFAGAADPTNNQPRARAA